MTTQQTNETESETISAQEIYDEAKQLICSLTEQGAMVDEIIYTFAYLTAEYGLTCTRNSFKVFPIILGGLRDAGYEKMEEEEAA
jgi:hypothetical protein